MQKQQEITQMNIKKAQLGLFESNNQPTILAKPKFKESAYNTPSKYDTGLAYGENEAEHRAYKQDNWEALGIKTANTVNNFIPSAIENIALIRGLWMNSEQSRQYTESVDKIASEYKNIFGKGIFGESEVYTEGDTGAWWIDSLGSLVESGASFALTGGVIGAGIKGLSTLAKVRQLAGVMTAVNGGMNLDTALKRIHQVENLATTYFTSATEGQLNGLEASKNIEAKYNSNAQYKQQIDKQAKLAGKTSKEYLNSIKNSAFATAANISTMVGMPLNITGINAIFTPTKVMQQYRKSAGSLFSKDSAQEIAQKFATNAPKTRTWKEFTTSVGQEMLQESIEEGSQSIAGKIAENRASKGKDKIALGDYFTAFSELEELGTKVLDKELFTSMMLGALGGGIQTGFVQGISNQKKQNKKDQEDYQVLKNDFLSNLEKATTKKKELDGILESIKTEEDYTKNKDRIDSIKEELYNLTLREALKKDNLDGIENDLKQFLNLDENTNPKLKADNALEEFKKTKLEGLLNEFNIQQEQLDLIESNPSAFSPQVLEEITKSPVYEEYKKLKNTSETASNENLKTALQLNDDYKEVASKKIQELKSLKKKFSSFRYNYPENNQSQKLNTIDIFLQKEEVNKLDEEIKKREAYIAEQNAIKENADAIEKEMAKMLSVDYDYQKLIADSKLDEAKQLKERYTENYKRNKDSKLTELKEKRNAIVKDVNFKDTEEYYKALENNDYVNSKSKTKEEKNKKEEIKKFIEKTKFNQTLQEQFTKELMINQLVNKGVNASIDTFEKFEELLTEILKTGSTQEAITFINNMLKYLPKSYEQELKAILNKPEIQTAFLQSDVRGILKKEDIIDLQYYDMEEAETISFQLVNENGEPLTLQESSELFTLDESETTNKIINTYSQGEESDEWTISGNDFSAFYSKLELTNEQLEISLKNWNPIAPKALREKEEIVNDYIKASLNGFISNMQELETNEDLINTVELDDIKNKIETLKENISTNTTYKFKDFTKQIEKADKAYNKARAIILERIEKRKGDELALFNNYNTPLPEEVTKNNISVLEGLDNGNADSILYLINGILSNKSVVENKEKLTIDIHNLYARFEMSDNLLNLLIQDYPHKKEYYLQAKQLIDNFAGREAELYYSSPLMLKFDGHLKTVVDNNVHYPSPEQFIAIKQAVALLLNNNFTYTQGVAGTGKTALVAKYVKEILEQYGKEVIVTAVGERVHEKINKELNGNPISTHNINTDIVNFVENLPLNATVIIDEAPKLSETEVLELNKALNKRNDVVIYYTGDPLQLTGNTTWNIPPLIKLNSNPVLATIPLTQSKRTNNSNVLKLQNQLSRDGVTNDSFTYETKDGVIVEGVKSVQNSKELLNQNVQGEVAIITNSPESYKDSKYIVLTPTESQGLDFDTILVDLDDRATNKEKYVATSRAKKTIIMIGNFESTEQPYTERKTDNTFFKENETWFKENVLKEKPKKQKIKEKEIKKEEIKKEEIKKEISIDEQVGNNIGFSEAKVGIIIGDTSVRAITDNSKEGITTITLKTKDGKIIGGITISNEIDGYEGININVNSEYQGKGISKYLYNLALADAKSRGLKGLYSIDNNLKTEHKSTRKNFKTSKSDPNSKINKEISKQIINELKGKNAEITLITDVSTSFEKEGAIKYNKTASKENNNSKKKSEDLYNTELANRKNNEEETDAKEENNEENKPLESWTVNNKNLNIVLESNQEVLVYEVYGKLKNGSTTIFAIAKVGDEYLEIGQRYQKIDDTEGKIVYTYEEIKDGILPELEQNIISTKTINKTRTNKIERIVSNESSSLADKYASLVNNVKELAGGGDSEVKVEFKINTNVDLENQKNPVFAYSNTLPSGSVSLKFTVNGTREFYIPVDGAIITPENNKDFNAIFTFMQTVKVIEEVITEDGEMKAKFMSSKPSGFKANTVEIAQEEVFDDLVKMAEGIMPTGNVEKVQFVITAFNKLSKEQREFLKTFRSQLYTTDTANAFNYGEYDTTYTESDNVNSIAQGNVEILEKEPDSEGYYLVRKSNKKQDIVRRKILNVVHKDDDMSIAYQIKIDFYVDEDNNKDLSTLPSVSMFYVGQEMGNIQENIDKMFEDFQRKYVTLSNNSKKNVKYQSSSTHILDKNRKYTVEEMENDILIYKKTGEIIKGYNEDGEPIKEVKTTKKRERLQANFDTIVSANQYGEGGTLLRKLSRDESAFPIWISSASDKHQLKDSDATIDTRDVIESFLNARLYVPLQKKEIADFNSAPDANSSLLKKMVTKYEGFNNSNLFLDNLDTIETVLINNIETLPEITENYLKEVRKNIDTYTVKELELIFENMNNSQEKFEEDYFLDEDVTEEFKTVKELIDIKIKKSDC